MALNKSTLKTKIQQAFDAVSDVEIDPAVARSQVAQGIADAIDTYIKAADVTVATGIPVSTTGTPTAQTGATTGTGTGKIS